jgi:hypothetical protein
MELIKSHVISDFPSGSSINFYKGNLYLIGDDSTNILILDSNYNKIDAVHLFDFEEKRIPKTEKIDLEGSVIYALEGVDHMLIVGSASRKNRKRIILIPFSENRLDFKTLKNAIHKTKVLAKRITASGIEEINLEGVCILKDDLILGNRGNRSQQSNHIIVTDKNFWQHQDDAKLIIRKLILPETYANAALGLSELCYIEQIDTLMITFTTEATDNAYDDGAIGDSYFGIIKNAAAKLQAAEIVIEKMIKLSDVDTIFSCQKIEGICVESIIDSEIIFHLVADNDLGESRLFKVRMLWDELI